MSLKLEVIRVVFLNMVSEFRVLDIGTPAHVFREGDSIRQFTELNVHVVSLVRSTHESIGVVLASPAHEGRFERTSVREINSPVFTDLFVSRVTVQVLLLRHVNSANLVTVSLSIPRCSPDSFSFRAERTLMSSLVRTEAIRVL